MKNSLRPAVPREDNCLNQNWSVCVDTLEFVLNLRLPIIPYYSDLNIPSPVLQGLTLSVGSLLQSFVRFRLVVSTLVASGRQWLIQVQIQSLASPSVETYKRISSISLFILLLLCGCCYSVFSSTLAVFTSLFHGETDCWSRWKDA